jgi:hypothetical protein
MDTTLDSFCVVAKKADGYEGRNPFLRAFLLLLRYGSSIAVPFSLMENGHESCGARYTYRRNALASLRAHR